MTVAEELHFGRAAERLHIVQSAVSQQVQRLERELNVRLFDRSSRHVRLSAAGTRFLPEARALLVAEQRARAAACGPPGERRAVTLRLGTSTGLGSHLDRLLDAFAARAPTTTTLELVSVPVRSRLDMVRAGQLDAAFVRSDDDADAPGLRVVPLWNDPLVAVLPAGHPLTESADVAPADLAGLPLRLTSRRNNPALVDLVVTACQDAGFEPIPGPPSSSLQNALAAIGSGEPMWTVIYASHANLLHAPRVAFRPFRGAGLSLPTGLAVRADASSAALDLLIDACTAAAPGPDHLVS